MDVLMNIVDSLWTGAVTVTMLHYWWRNKSKESAPSASTNTGSPKLLAIVDKIERGFIDGKVGDVLFAINELRDQLRSGA